MAKYKVGKGRSTKRPISEISRDFAVRTFKFRLIFVPQAIFSETTQVQWLNRILPKFLSK